MNLNRFPFIGIGLILAGALTAQGPAEAEALVKQAVGVAKERGTYRLIKEVNTAGGSLRSGDLYLWIIDTEGVMLANGANAKMIGKDNSEKIDPDALNICQEALRIAETKGRGWFTYKFTHPETKKLLSKECYVEKLDTVIIACGAYKK